MTLNGYYGGVSFILPPNSTSGDVVVTSSGMLSNAVALPVSGQLPTAQDPALFYYDDLADFQLNLVPDDWQQPRLGETYLFAWCYESGSLSCGYQPFTPTPGQMYYTTDIPVQQCQVTQVWGASATDPDTLYYDEHPELGQGTEGPAFQIKFPCNPPTPVNAIAFPMPGSTKIHVSWTPATNLATEVVVGGSYNYVVENASWIDIPAAPGQNYQISIAHGNITGEGNPVTLNINSSSPAVSTAILSGSNVIVSGWNFGNIQGSSTVSINGIHMLVSFWSDGQITAVLPNGTTGGDLAVTVGAMTSNTVHLDPPNDLAPIITSLSLSRGPQGMGFVINGHNFSSQSSTSSVTLGGSLNVLTILAWDPLGESITVQIPPTVLTGGDVVVQVGNLTSNGVPFELVQPVGCPAQ